MDQDGSKQTGPPEGLGESVAALHMLQWYGARVLQVALFLMGTINNLPYVVVNSSANILASRSVRARRRPRQPPQLTPSLCSFNKDNLVPLVMFANVAFGIFGGSELS